MTSGADADWHLRGENLRILECIFEVNEVTMSGFRVRFFKKVLGGNGHEVDACQYSFETLANTHAEAEKRAKKAFCEDHHLMNWTIHADRCQVHQADLPS